MGWGAAEESWRKGPWTSEEDRLLIEYVELHGEGRWNSVARLAGLKRNGKSCRLRWVNYLRPDLKRGHITPHEESIILDLHSRWGNRWSTIARRLPGRTDNEVKNYWRTHFKKKIRSPNNPEKGKTNILKKQQLQLQKQYLQREEQKQQLLQLNQLDTKKHMSSLVGQTETYNDICLAANPEMIQDVTISAAAYAPDDKTQLYDYYPTANGYAPPVAEALNDDDAVWEGLWIMDGGYGDIGGACVPRKGCFQNVVAPFC